MNSDILVVLDACALVPAALRDALMRCAEEPRLYLPRWSEEIIAEMVRTLRVAPLPAIQIASRP